MKEEVIKNILKFMSRVELHGYEVPAFVVCMDSLEAMLLSSNEDKADV